MASARQTSPQVRSYGVSRETAQRCCDGGSQRVAWICIGHRMQGGERDDVDEGHVERRNVIQTCYSQVHAKRVLCLDLKRLKVRPKGTGIRYGETSTPVCARLQV